VRENPQLAGISAHGHNRQKILKKVIRGLSTKIRQSIQIEVIRAEMRQTSPPTRG
jgi:hypothetical protein